MNLKMFAAALAVTTVAGSAFAADLPGRKAEPVYAAPVMSWSGLYIGVNAGYGWSTGRTSIASNPSWFAPTWGTELAASSTLSALPLGNGSGNGGFLGGAQVGWNWQVASFVLGLESDIQWLGGNRNGGSAGGALVPVGFPGELIVSSSTGSSRVEWLGTVRARAGYLLTPSLLAYVTGGLAYGSVKGSAVILQTNQPFAPGFFSAGSTSSIELGGTLGAGAEYKFTPNWSLKAEYLYYDLGKAQKAMSPLSFPALYSSNPTLVAAAKGHIVRAGLNYQFTSAPAAVVANY